MIIDHVQSYMLSFRSLLFSVVSAGIGWRYGRDAEAEWGGLCGAGLAQSPVDLGPGSQAEFDADLGELVFVKYDTKVRLWELIQVWRSYISTWLLQITFDIINVERKTMIRAYADMK